MAWMAPFLPFNSSPEPLGPVPLCRRMGGKARSGPPPICCTPITARRRGALAKRMLVHGANDAQQGTTTTFSQYLLDKNPFAFSDRCRLRNDDKRDRRRGPEGVAYSTSFTPTRGSRNVFRAFALEMH